MVELQRVPNDLLLILIEHIDDLPTLSKFVQAYPSLLWPPLERRSDILTSRITRQHWPEEHSHYVYTIVSAAMAPQRGHG